MLHTFRVLPPPHTHTQWFVRTQRLIISLDENRQREDICVCDCCKCRKGQVRERGLAEIWEGM